MAEPAARPPRLSMACATAYHLTGRTYHERCPGSFVSSGGRTEGAAPPFEEQPCECTQPGHTTPHPGAPA